MSTRAWLAGGAVLGAWWWLHSRTKKATRAPSARRVLLIGDSLGVGLRPLLEAYYADQGAYFHGAVEGGTNARQWRFRVGPLVEHRPDLVLVSLGTNDALSESLRPEFAANMYQICAAFRGVRCLWLRAPNRTAGMVQTNVQALDPPPGVELQPDGIHPTMAGYTTWAARVVG